MAVNVNEALGELDLDKIEFTKADGRTQILFAYGNAPFRSVGSVTVNPAEAMLFEKLITEVLDLKRQVATLKKREKAAV